MHSFGRLAGIRRLLKEKTFLCATAALLAAVVLFGCGGSGSTETSTLKVYSTGTKLGERGPSPIDPVESSGPVATELENYLIENYKGESWYPSLEDVWSADGTAVVTTDLTRSAKDKETAEEVCAVVRKIKIKHRVRTITVLYGVNEQFEC